MPRPLDNVYPAQSPQSTLARSRVGLRRWKRRFERLPQSVPLAWQKMALARSIRHVSGARTVAYARDELIVLCLVRDGERLIQPFIEHYVALGVKHIVFLDNNSRDITIQIARNYPNVTVLQTSLPFKKYQFLMREYLIKRFGSDRWVLYVDIDEFFEYPFSSRLKLPALLAYLDANHYTAVVGQMLDLFAYQPDGAPQRSDETLRQQYRWYDIADIQRLNYARSFKRDNSVSNDRIELYWGGVRKRLFGTDDWLSKHPLVFVGGTTTFRGNTAHDVFGVRVADFSCVLLHYKFLDNFRALTARAVQEQNYINDSAQYKRYHQVLQEQPDMQIYAATSRELHSVDDLIEQQFLVVSEAYQAWAEGQHS